jgi:CDP-glycerol glycerophosphotransferase (TagB/SpsB family)
MEYEPTAPGPHATTAEELADWLSRLDEVTTQYAPTRRHFAATYSMWEDGQAGQRVIEAVFQ